MTTKCPKCHYDNPADTNYCGKCATQIRPFEGDTLSKTITTGAHAALPGRERIIAGKYTIISELGKGGMGVVYKAEDTKLERMVALKFLPPELTEDPEARERFVREAKAAAALSHNHICTVYEIGEEENQLFIAMECIEGESLRQKILRGSLPHAEALDIAIQVAEGLAEAHKKMIIHRDVKPGNIMLTEKGAAKVMDFGLAKALGRSLITKEARTMGTVAYMSPEQAQGRPVDYRTDIWSLGVVLYEMLTGTLPFKGEYDQSIIHSILNREPEPVSKLRKDLPKGLEQIIGRSLAKDPADRYQSMEELLEDLKAVAEGLKPLKAKMGLFHGRILGLKKIYAYAGFGGLIVLFALAMFFLFRQRGLAFDSIAVLPFENLSGDPRQDYFSDGMQEALITDLGQLAGLKRVIARSSMMRFRGTKTPPRKIAQELKVAVLITGAVLRSGDRVRITAQLIDPATEAQIWAKSYERNLSDILSLQNEIVSAVTREVKVKLTPQEATRLASARKVNPQAYEAYLMGLSHWYKLTRQDLDSALQYFELALEKDPQFAQAYAGIAGVWVGRQQQGFVPTLEAAPRAKAAAAKALELDSTLAEVHNTLAGIKTWTDWDWEGGEAEYRRAIELNPNYPDPRTGLSHLLNILGRPKEAMAQIERALELDPLNALFRGFYAMDLMYARRYDDAIALLRDTLKNSPNDPVTLSTLRSAYHMKHMYPEALEAWKASYAARGDHEAEEALARGFKEAGYQGALLHVAEMLVARSATTYVTPWQIGTLYTRAGRNDEALDWLEKAFQAHDPNMPYLSVDPIFDGLRGDPRFQALLQRMNLR
ncbi:MAG: protein kinase [Candidatus Aminicenantes bacterium]|nr:protein kinase [Candidatus Aminicenantes bacterium]